MPVDDDQVEEEEEVEEEDSGEDVHEEEEKIDPRTLLTHDQFVQLQSIFGHYDFEKKDKIQVKLIGYILRMMGLNPSKEEIKDIMLDADPLKKGYMSFQMFLSAMAPKMNDVPETHEDIIAAFRVFDEEGNGYIVNDFLSENLSSLAEDLDDVELELFFKMADPKSTGKVYYIEFVEKMMGVVRRSPKRDKGEKKKGGKGKAKKKKEETEEGEEEEG